MTGSKLTGLTLKTKGFNELHTSPGVVAELQGIVDQILTGAGDGYDGDVQRGKTRARGGVVTTTGAAIRDNARNNTLVRELTGARRA